jgi:glycosyltransferase involved in cell wall biosynthesis
MLTVLNVAYPFAPVDTDAVGGAEQVVASLDRALTRAGHRSLVLACEGSHVAGMLLPVPRPEGLIDDALRRAVHAQCRRVLRTALKRWAVDVVHMHGIDFDAYRPQGDVPVLVTLHLPLDWYPRDALAKRPGLWFNAVSAAQHRSAPPGLSMLPEIGNGVPLSLFASHLAKRGYALCLGRICPEKGFHIALDAARMADMPLLLAGDVFPYPAHQTYFREEIAPRLDARRRFIGKLGLRRKRRLLAAAQCIVVPSLAPETSSLVAMEALASGTPVVAFPAGALTDIVEHGRTGFLVHDTRAMARAMREAAHLSPQACRRTAERRFDLNRTTATYLALYEALAETAHAESCT